MGFHLDTTGNVWLGSGSSGTTLAQAITNGPPNFYVTSLGSIYAAAGTVGGITIDSTGISANYASGSTGFKIFSSDGSAEFNDVTVRGTLDGPSLTGNLTGNTSSSIQVGGSSQDFVKLYYDNTFGGSIVFDAGGVDRFFADYDAAGTFSLRTGLNTDLELLSQGGDMYFYSDTIYFRDNPLGSDAPILKLWNGSSYVAGNNQVLGADTSGNLEWTTVASSPVTSISGSGEITVTESSGAYTIEHADSDHDDRFVRTSNASAHVHSAYDNYGSWTAKAGGNNMTVQSGYGVEWKAGTGISLSVNTSPYEITINNTATGSSGVTSVSGSTSAAADGQFFRTLAVGGTTLYFYESTRGDDLTIQGQRPTSNNTSSVGLSATQYNEVHARYGYFDFITGGNVSSQEVKTDITDLDLGLDFINALAPKKYKYKPELKEDDGKYGFGFIAEEIETLLENEGQSNSKLHQDGHTDYPNYGRCAHELVCTCEDEECCPEPVRAFDRITQEWTYTPGCVKDAKCTMPCCTDVAGATIDGRNYVHATEEECEESYIDGRKYSSVIKEELIAPLVKSVQELSTQISDLTARVEALEG